ncbi:choline-binding protein D, partial [Helcococcus ovis]
YYLLDNGEMATSKWIKHTDSKWYYLLDNGEMATSKWINGWYVNADGVWVE